MITGGGNLPCKRAIATFTMPNIDNLGQLLHRPLIFIGYRFPVTLFYLGRKDGI